MSISYNAYVIYGFPVPPGRNKIQAQNPVNEFGKDMYLDEWLEASKLRPLEQINAGQTNGGCPDFLCGVFLHKLEDFTRGGAYCEIGLNKPSDDVIGKIIYAKRALVPESLMEDFKIGFYLVGEAA